LLGIFLGLSVPGGWARAADGLIFDREFVALGRVEVAGDLIQEFPFKVAGEAPVQILDLKASCGCITPTLSKRVYGPGERDTLVFGIHAASQSEGKKRFQVSLSYRQTGDVVTVPIFVDVELYRPIAVEPSTLLVHVSGERPFRQSLTVRHQRGEPLGEIRASVSTPKMVARVLPGVAGESSQRRVEVQLATDFPMGKTDERILLHIDGDKPVDIVVPVSVVRASRIKVLPEVLHAHARGGQAPSWQVLVSDARGEPIRIDRIEGPGSIVRVSYPKEATKACRLQVKIDPQASATKIDESITVHLAEPIATKLVLPVRVD
jgi:hypothetical protein